ncbi:ABC transporter permease [Methylogaea oryzae]|uniref:ABC transporter permease n=1 Tax=Methylogaea oryzae TaxID=1295382 RepID=UPI0006D14A40|nr:FtsX-like permease family protein [Methylogaea oryzae]
MGVGDRLAFTVAGRKVQATVSSLRSLRWDSMTPNFYVIFPPGALRDFPYSYLTSFHLPAERRAELADLPRQFPGVTLLDVDQLLRQLQTVLRQATLAVNGVLVFALAAGLAVLWAAVLNQADERLKEDALLRALGAERRLLRRSRLLEFALLGALAGSVAAMVAEGLIWVLYRRVLHMDAAFHGPLWLDLPAVGALLVAACGLLLTRRAVTVGPLTVLREG